VALGEHRDHRHETKRFGKVSELEIAMQLAVGMVPAVRCAAHETETTCDAQSLRTTCVLPEWGEVDAC